MKRFWTVAALFALSLQPAGLRADTDLERELLERPSVPAPEEARPAIDLQRALQGKALKVVRDKCKDSLPELHKSEYYDFDGDGSDEAVGLGASCLSKGGAADLFGVFSRGSMGAVYEMKVDTQQFKFKGRDYKLGLRGKMTFEVEDGRLVQVFPVYKKSGGKVLRKFVYRYEPGARMFKMENVVETPPPAAPK